MKRHTSIILGAGLLAATSFANAAGQLAPVQVQSNSQSIAAECTPPNDAEECAEFHAEIRRNFSPREIGMLFGASSAYQEYLTSNDRLRVRYSTFVRKVQESSLALAVADR